MPGDHAVCGNAVEWVRTPGTFGMSQHDKGSIMASTPCAAGRRRIQRMTNDCRGCRDDPGKRAGQATCRLTTLYWNFPMRHRGRVADKPRAGNQWQNPERVAVDEKHTIRGPASRLRGALA